MTRHTPPDPLECSESPSGQGARALHPMLPLLIKRTNASVARLADVADGAGLMFLLLAAATLLLRPTELFPALDGIPLYEGFVFGCLVAGLPRVVEQLAWRAVFGNAIVLLALVLVPAVMLSHLSSLNTYDARFGGAEMAKACLLFLLVIVLVRSPAKLRATLLAVVISLFGLTVLAVLQFHGLIDLPALQPVEQWRRGSDPLLRLSAVGVFNDPNDYSLVLVIAIVVCAYGMGERRAGRAAMLFIPAFLLFAYALVLTQSRGGLISGAAALLAFLPARYGWRNALPLACVLLPVLVVAFWGRATSVNLGDRGDTFQTRLELWSESLDAFRSAPLFGIGQEKMVDRIGQVTHNSFLQAYAEMGLLGGTAFIGLFYLLLGALWRAAPQDPELARLRPFVLALTAGYAAGLLSLSRCYAVPTQLIVALGTVYLLLAARAGAATLPRWDWACFRRVAGVGLLFLAATYVFVRIMIVRGGT